MITKQAESLSEDGSVSVTRGAWLVGLLAAVLVLLSLTGESGRELLRYEREAVLQGQYWRLLTGHLVRSGSGSLHGGQRALPPSGVVAVADGPV